MRETILLVDPDSLHREQCAAWLRERGYVVIGPDVSPVLKGMAEIDVCRIDFIVVELSGVRLTDEIKRTLRKLTSLRKPDGFPILVLACTELDHGDDYQLDLEELGWRFVFYGEEK
ncbi:MAG: hypothetical protein DMG65_19580 [Candidatus Angelobacter sp. Gp1-AA117]|nr:MAG: hypothetical protein DMG65_19580 [Candidatus Angelobacter sp. Gp1-AA117]